MDLNSISPIALIILAIVVAAVVVGLILYLKKERTRKLRSKFGPEYERASEAELEKRAKRVARYDIHPLTTEECSRYAGDWGRAQSLFVDDPKAAVQHADMLVQDVMKRRGYPVGDFEQNAADLSVDHPRVVEHYRIAHEIALQDERGRGTTEDLRKAMVSYHALFDDLLDQPTRTPERVRTPEEIRK